MEVSKLNYVVIEIQTTGENVTSALTYDYTDRASAESKYHTILAYAAVGDLFIHTAAIIDAQGTVLKRDSYRKDDVFNYANEEALEGE